MPSLAKPPLTGPTCGAAADEQRRGHKDREAAPRPACLTEEARECGRRRASGEQGAGAGGGRSRGVQRWRARGRDGRVSCGVPDAEPGRSLQPTPPSRAKGGRLSGRPRFGDSELAWLERVGPTARTAVTKDRDYKRVVRRLARASGERYTEARARLETAVPASDGFLHDLGFYRSDKEFRLLAVRFAEEGLAAGEPVVFAYDDRKTELLQRWLPDTPLLTFCGVSSRYPAPGRTLARWRHLAMAARRAGASRIRLAGDVPHPGYGRSFVGWDRYEAAVDRALGDLPIWGRCLYDLRVAPEGVVAAATRHHRHVITATGERRANPAFSPAHCLSEFLSPDPDPLEGQPPDRMLVEPTPAQARGALRALATDTIAASELDELLLATSEAVTNGLLHGMPPVTVRAWVGDGRAVVIVHDRGRGPADPLAGLVPGTGAGGRGLWIAHQLDLDVALHPDSDGFAVRLRAGRVPAPVSA